MPGIVIGRTVPLHECTADGIEDSVCTKDIGDDVCQDNPGYEVRQIYDRLNRLFELHILYLIQQQCEHQRNDDIQDNLCNCNDQCVDKCPFCIRDNRQVFKPFPALPTESRTILYSDCNPGSHYNTDHRDDGKHEQPDITRQNH